MTGLRNPLVLGVWVAAALVTLGYAAHFRDFNILHPVPPARDGDNISQRCIDNSVTPVSCADVDSPDALLPHPDDCRLFYYCVTHQHAPVCRDCPGGLHFSPTEHICDRPEHAGCALNNNTAAAVLVV